MFCCKIFNRALRQILSLWYPREPVVYQYTRGNLTVVESISLNETIYKFKVWKEPRLFSQSELNTIIYSKVQTPWLWVGASSIFGEVDMTSSIAPYIVNGNIITPSLLSNVYPLLYNWKYLDPVTFKEVDFPDSGIIIDAPRVERSAQEIQETENN